MIAREIQKAYDAVRDRGVIVQPSRWQSMDVSKRPEATTLELLNHTLRFQMTEDLDHLRKAVAPNLPWADDHFLERVCGVPLNPGETWRWWPWGNSAANFRRASVFGEGATKLPDGSNEPGFDHSYMERMWAKAANLDNDGIVEGGRFYSEKVHHGIRYAYGDANDVIDHLAKHPDSRQAYLPIWFPEDTGKTDVRVPCTLGYHFIHRHGYLHCTYYIRSCDLYRHFRDDVYLTARLQLWVLDQLRQKPGVTLSTNPPQHAFDWKSIKPGLFTMHIVSLHAFVNDCRLLWPGWQQ